MAEAALVKGLGGLGVAGAAGAGGYVVYESYSSNTVERALIEEGLNVLSFGDENNEKWQTIAASCKDAKGRDEKEVNGFVKEEITNADVDKGKFEEPCKKVLSRQFIDVKDENFVSASKWCVEKETVQKTLERKGFKFIEESEGEEWEKAVSKTTQSNGVKKDNANYTKDTLKEDCTSKKAIETTNKDYWSERGFVIDYCTKAK